MPALPDVLIVGGGVIGLTAAYYLALENVSVVLIDRGDFGQEASWAGAGILPPASSRATSDGFERLHQLSLSEFPKLSADLVRQTGIDNGFRVSGGLEFLAGSAGGHAGEWSGAGVQAEPLEESATREREPALAAGLGPVMYLPELAQVRNPWHVRALAESCRLFGVGLRPRCAFQNIKRTGDRVTAIRTSQGDLQAGKILFTSGAWTAEIVRALAFDVPIHPVRGQIALVKAAQQVFKPVLLWGARYIVPREDGRILAGSTEEAVGFEKQTTDDAIASLLAFAYRLVPSLANYPVEKRWAGLRPATPDGRPCIGRIPGWSNAYMAAGHFRSGIQLSPGTGMICKDLLLDRQPPLSLESLRPDRFSKRTNWPSFQPGTDSGTIFDVSSEKPKE
jgi:glycine oxidase